MASTYLTPQLNFVDTSSKIRLNFLIRSRWSRWGPEKLRSWLRTALLSIQYHQSDQDSWSIPSIVRDVEKKSRPTDEDMMFQPLLPPSWEQSGSFRVTRAQITKVARMMPSFRVDLEGFLSDLENELYVGAVVPKPNTGESSLFSFLRGSEAQTPIASPSMFTFGTNMPQITSSSSFATTTSAPSLFSFGTGSTQTTNPGSFGTSTSASSPFSVGTTRTLQSVPAARRPLELQPPDAPAKRARVSESSDAAPNEAAPAISAITNSEIDELKAKYESTLASLTAENEWLRTKTEVKPENQPSLKKEEK